MVALAEFASQIATGIVENVIPAIVDELHHPNGGEAETEAVTGSLIDILGSSHAVFDHARRFGHNQSLQPGDDESGSGRTYHRYFADRFEQHFQTAEHSRVGPRMRAQFDQRNDIRGIEPVRVKESFGMRYQPSEMRDQNGRSGRG